MPVSCLDSIVGLSDRDCDCLSGGRPADWNDSDSGYYLTDAEYGFPMLDAVFANVNCAETNVWDSLAASRSEAIRDFQGDLIQMLYANKETKVPNWRGLIGKTDGSWWHTADYMGVQLRPKLRLKDAAFVVTAIHTAIETPGTYTVEITSNDYEFTPESLLVNATGGVWQRTPLPTPIRLPFYKLNEESLRYSISLLANGSRTRANRAYCCSKPEWLYYFDYGGFGEREINNEVNYCNSTFGGVAVEGHFDCDSLGWICNLQEMNGYDIQDLIARCIQFKGAAKMISKVLESGRVNYWTALAPDNLVAKRQRLMDSYKEYMTWMVKNLPGTISGCWGCDKKAPRIKTIIS